MNNALQRELDKAGAKARAGAIAGIQKLRADWRARKEPGVTGIPPGPIASYLKANSATIFWSIVVLAWICLVTAKFLGWTSLSWQAVTLGFALGIIWLFIALLSVGFVFYVLPNLLGLLVGYFLMIFTTRPTKMPVWPYVFFGVVAFPVASLAKSEWFALTCCLFVVFCLVCGRIAYRHRAQNAEKHRIKEAKRIPTNLSGAAFEKRDGSKTERPATSAVDAKSSTRPESQAIQIDPSGPSIESKLQPSNPPVLSDVRIDSPQNSEPMPSRSPATSDPHPGESTEEFCKRVGIQLNKKPGYNLTILGARPPLPSGVNPPGESSDGRKSEKPESKAPARDVPVQNERPGANRTTDEIRHGPIGTAGISPDLGGKSGLAASAKTEIGASAISSQDQASELCDLTETRESKEAGNRVWLTHLLVRDSATLDISEIREGAEAGDPDSQMELGGIYAHDGESIFDPYLAMCAKIGAATIDPCAFESVQGVSAYDFILQVSEKWRQAELLPQAIPRVPSVTTLAELQLFAAAAKKAGVALNPDRSFTASLPFLAIVGGARLRAAMMCIVSKRRSQKSAEAKGNPDTEFGPPKSIRLKVDEGAIGQVESSEIPLLPAPDFSAESTSHSVDAADSQEEQNVILPKAAYTQSNVSNIEVCLSELQRAERALNIPEDHLEAAKWFRAAACQGNLVAQCRMGTLCALGKGVPQDFAEARSWFLKGAERGYCYSEFFLGTMYFRGDGVQLDHAEAAKWMRKAALNRHTDAVHTIASMYSEGQGVPKDAIESLAWVIVAERLGDQKAIERRSTMEAHLKPDQILEAQNRAEALLALMERRG